MAELLKELFSKELVLLLSEKIKEEYQDFKKEEFVNHIFNETWKKLELKERMRHISLSFNEFLPFEYKKQIEILRAVKIRFLDVESQGLQFMVFQDFVEVFGLEDHETSIIALELFTINSSSEFAIRQFILKDEEKTMAQMLTWAKSKNEHIRRLASEGCRPRLPWAVNLPSFKKNPLKILEVLELLKNDESLYVRKSVANNLNDISKDNPNLLIDFVKKNIRKTKELDWICKHASRTLLKKGDKTVLKLFGFEKSSHVEVLNFICDKKVSLGDDLNFSFELKSEKKLGALRVEYVIDYLKANKTHSKKVFMVSQNEFKTKSKAFVKKQNFKDMTTRKHYLGKHFISILINGQEFIKEEFILKA